MIADLADIHANNKIGMPSYSKQSYGNTVSYKKNSSGNGFRFPDKRYQGSSNYNKQSQSERNSPERKSYENQDQREHQKIKESLNRVHQEDLVVDIQGQMTTGSVVTIVIQISI